MDSYLPSDGGLDVSGGGLLRFTTAGSVDDGKSSLIGRMLFDAGVVPADQIAALGRTAARRGEEDIDLSELTDGLTAEREQGITIDVAYRYFATPRRKFIIADTPGHEQYTRNMVTGASTADAAVILVDVRKGPTLQTRRHLYLAHLLGIRHLVVAVNKMDLVGYAAERYTAIAATIGDYAAAVGAAPPIVVPVSAKRGDNVVHRSENMAWYRGSPLLTLLEELPPTHWKDDAAFRMPVQIVQRIAVEGGHARRYLGRITAGTIAVGDRIVVSPASTTSRIQAITTYDGALQSATAPMSVAIELADDIDVARGDVLAAVAALPHIGREVEATLCWFTDRPYDKRARYLLKSATRTTPVRIAAIRERVDVADLSTSAAPETLERNDIARVSLVTAEPIAYDSYRDDRTTGAFILIEEATNATAAAGMIEG